MQVRLIFGLAFLLLAVAGADAETPMIDKGLAPLPGETRLERLLREQEAVRREAREIGGGDTIRGSIRETNGRIYLKRQAIERLEEVASDLGATREEMERMRAEADKAISEEAKGSAGDQVLKKAAKEVGKQFLKEAAKKYLGVIGFIMDSTEEAVLAHIRDTTRESFNELIRSNQLNQQDVNRLLGALYQDLGSELGTLRRLSELDRRDGELFREIAGERGTPQPDRRPALERADDREYDDLLKEMEQLRFQLRLATQEGRRADAELLRIRIADMERRLERREAAPAPRAPGCDVIGGGFFYIPGTETCLRIGGSLRYSRIDDPSDLGGGTVVRSMDEGFLFRLPSTIDRWGGEIGFETPTWEEIFGLEPGDLSPGAEWMAQMFFYGDIEGAWGAADSASAAEIGIDGVSGLGSTFADENSAFGTGFIASSTGFALEGSGSIDSAWMAGTFGIGRAIPLGGASPSALVLKAGLYAEGLDFNADGSTRLLFGGAQFENFHQDFDYESSDRYYGVKLEAQYLWAPSPRMRISVGASAYPAYHSGKGRYRLETGSFSTSAPVIENYSYDESGFTVGVGLSAGIDFAITPNLSIGTGAEISWLPGVTAFDAAASPSSQPAKFHKEDVTRVFFDILKVRATF